MYEDFQCLSLEELLRHIRWLRREISSSWRAEQRLLKKVRSEVHDGEEEPNAREIEVLAQVDQIAGWRQGNDENDLLDAYEVLWQCHGKKPSRWQHPATEELRRQLIAKLAKICHDETQRNGNPAKAFHRMSAHLSRLMDMSLEAGDIGEFDWLQCEYALEMLERYPLPTLTLVR
jgi:hypothetical protein